MEWLGAYISYDESGREGRGKGAGTRWLSDKTHLPRGLADTILGTAAPGLAPAAGTLSVAPTSANHNH